MLDNTINFYERAEDSFNAIPREEVRVWCNHPITKSLKLSLTGDLSGHFEGWSNGEFTGENSDQTAQKNAKALGGVAAIEAILTWIEDAEKGDLYD